MVTYDEIGNPITEDDSDEFAKIGRVLGADPAQVSLAREQAAQTGMTARDYAKQVVPSLLVSSGLPVEEVNRKFAALQQALSPERQRQVESDYQSRVDIENLANLAGKIGASFDPTGKAQVQVGQTTERGLAQAREQTLGKFEREVKGVKDQFALAKDQLDTAIKLEKNDMDRKRFNSDMKKADLDIKKLEVDVKDAEQRADPTSPLSESGRAAILATPAGRDLVKQIGEDKFNTMNWNQLEKTFGNIKDLAAMKLQQDQLAVSRGQLGIAQTRLNWESADRKDQQDPNSAANIAFRGALKEQGVNVPDNYTLAIDKAGSNLAERLISAKTTAAGKVEQQVEKLSKDVAGIQPLLSAVESFEGVVGKYVPGFKLDTYDANTMDLPGVSLPGVGRISFHDADARAVESAASRIFNVELKDRSGAAVTTPEMERLKVEFGAGKFNSERELVARAKEYRDLALQELRNREAAYKPEVRQTYQDRGGRLSPSYASGNPNTTVQDTKVVGGKTYVKINGQWMEKQ